MRIHRFLTTSSIVLLAIGLHSISQAQVSPTSSASHGPANSSSRSSSRSATGFSPAAPAANNQAPAASSSSTVNNLDLPATDPGYQLSNGDEIAIIVWGEGDVSTNQRIDSKGIIRMPLIGDINLSNKTVRVAEKDLEQVLIDKKLLRNPMVTISVRDYAVREVSVLGAVNSPGKYRMPKEAGSIEIVELITSLGGFKPTAKSDEVKVSRVDEVGVETVSTVNVEIMITGKSGNKNSPKSFLIYPGDRIYVPERLF